MNARPWLRLLGGGCILNLLVTGLLVGVFSSLAVFSINSIVFPFLFGATASFGFSLYLMRQSDDPYTPAWRVFLAGIGVLLGSILTVFGIAGYLLVSGG